ncbi:hypothetical protein AAFC00_002394 [Neodothiora populina]|uniref:Apple domain-containing protein n=1 Tax=Neodothiora populina TaxID=2781224 RepID=A0ABR3P6Y3_9PEZI
MRVLEVSLALLTGYSLVDAQGIDFGKIYSAKPSLKSATPIKSSKPTINGASVVSSIVSVLNSQHAQTMSSAQSVTSKKSSSSTLTTMTTSTKKSASTSLSTASSKATTGSSSKTTSTSTTKINASWAIVSKATASDLMKASSKSNSITSSKHKRNDGESGVEKRAATSTSAAPTSGCTQLSDFLLNYTPNPNTPEGFGLDNILGNIAAGQWYPPPGYSTSFTGAFAANSAPVQYVGYRQLSSYDPSACAALCDAANGCSAFNIYYERDPVYVPNDQCTKPTAAVSVTCALWGGNIDQSSATNIGQYRKDFMVIIQGSNGYVKNSPPSSVANYTGPTALYGAVNSKAGFLNASFYPTYSTSACSSACADQTAKNRAAAIASNSITYSPCNYFNTFNISANGVFQGMYCQLYTTSTVAGSATVISSTQSNGLVYNVSYSYGYALYPQDSGSISTGWKPAPTGSAATCSSLGPVNSTLLDYNSYNYTLACGYDVLYSNDIGNSSNTDFYSCMNLCDNFPGCSGYAYSYNTCWFKNLTGTKQKPSGSPGVDMAWQGEKYAGFLANQTKSSTSSSTSMAPSTMLITSTTSSTSMVPTTTSTTSTTSSTSVAPTTTSTTSTTSKTSSSTSSSASVNPTTAPFYIQLTGTSNTIVQGQYLGMRSTTSGSAKYDLGVFVSSKSAATRFVINTDTGILSEYTNNVGWQSIFNTKSSSEQKTIWASQAVLSGSPSYKNLNCAYDKSRNWIACQHNKVYQLALTCNNDGYMYWDDVSGDCQYMVLTPIFTT